MKLGWGVVKKDCELRIANCELDGSPKSRTTSKNPRFSFCKSLKISPSFLDFGGAPDFWDSRRIANC